ncbi:MAG: cell division protein FtsZ [Methylotenera sp.]|nr:cell division protein FtsZ [Methylotenera sp.]
MSDLQIALIAIGALIIIAVLIINWWQERRFHRRLENNFYPLNNDALLDDPSLEASHLYDEVDNRATDHFSLNNTLAGMPMPDISLVEPSINFPIHTESADVFAEPLPADAVADSSPDVINFQTATVEEPIAAEALLAPENTAAPEPAVSLPAMLQGRIDLIALVHSVVEKSAHKLNDALAGLANGFGKPVLVHALDVNKQWHLLEALASNPETAHGPITTLTCSLQLADRGGAVTGNALSCFQLAVETAAAGINAQVVWQGTGNALANANSLDEFCITVDKTIGFHLENGEAGAFTGTKLRGLAEAQGLVLGAEGRFKYFDEADTMQLYPLFEMFNRDDLVFSLDMLKNSVVKRITFELDIPHVKRCSEAFNHMVQVARQMEVGLNAILVDDNNKVLGNIQIEKIRQQLKVIQITMLVRGIASGSDSAHRLFS